MHSMLDDALAYANLGWAVFPIKPHDKVPATEHGFKNATTDHNRIRAYWQRNPDANIGLACGASHLVVIDVDAAHGGMESWRDLRQELGTSIENTVVSETGGGGLHFLYRADGKTIRNSASRLGEGIDVRGDGGYIVVPPSIHPSGRPYNWALGCAPDERAPSSLPESLVARLVDRPVTELEKAADGTGIVEGRRNETLTSMAGTMRRKGLSFEAIEAALLVANRQRCHPPLAEDEVRRIAHNIAGYAPRPEILDLNQTDWGNAEALATLWGESLRFDHRRQRWLIWQGQRWAEDRDGQIERIAHDVARSRYAAAAVLDDKDERRQSIRWALHSENKNAIRALLDLAQSVQPIAFPGDDLDADPWLLGCENGVVDLRTGDLRDGAPDDHLTMSVPFPFDPSASCPRWLQFMEEVFGADAQLIAFIQVAVGYSITGDTREQCLFLCWGGGCNGKSVFLNTIRAMMGDYGTNTAFSTFELDTRSQIPNDIAALVGRRFVTASETAEARRLNEARVKAITGGDPLTCRFMRGEFFSYLPAYKVWLAMNHKPVVTGTDNGIWRRIRLIPFTVSFTGREDKTLGDKLKAELPGILNWAIQGALIWQGCGMVESEAVNNATLVYRQESDIIGQFMADCTERIVVGRVECAELYHEYERWCKEQGEKPINGNAFGRRMTELGFERVMTHGTRYYRGIAINGKDPLPDTQRINL